MAENRGGCMLASLVILAGLTWYFYDGISAVVEGRLPHTQIAIALALVSVWIAGKLTGRRLP